SAVPPESSGLNSRTGLGTLCRKGFQFLGHTQVFSVERPEFRAGKSIIAERRCVKRQKRARLEIEYPHGQGVFIEQKAVLFLGLSKFRLALPAQRDFPLQLFIG